jgi:hypothetical protein
LLVSDMAAREDAQASGGDRLTLIGRHDSHTPLTLTVSSRLFSSPDRQQFRNP